VEINLYCSYTGSTLVARGRKQGLLSGAGIGTVWSPLIQVTESRRHRLLSFQSTPSIIIILYFPKLWQPTTDFIQCSSNGWMQPLAYRMDSLSLGLTHWMIAIRSILSLFSSFVRLDSSVCQTDVDGINSGAAVQDGALGMILPGTRTRREIF